MNDSVVSRFRELGNSSAVLETSAKIGGTYLLYDVVTGKSYVGSCSDIYHRKFNHFSDLRNNCHKNSELQAAYNAAPEDEIAFNKRFSHEFIPTETREQAFDIEQKVLDEFIGTGALFNIAPNARSSNAGVPMTDEQKQKIGDGNRGKIRSPEEIERIRQLHLGTKQSEETKQKRSESMIGKNVGKTHSEESRAQMSASHSGKVLTEEHRKNISEAGKGRVNSEETLENMRQAAIQLRGRKVSVSGTVYETIRAAAVANGISDATARDRCDSATGRFANWVWM